MNSVREKFQKQYNDLKREVISDRVCGITELEFEYTFVSGLQFTRNLSFYLMTGDMTVSFKITKKPPLDNFVCIDLHNGLQKKQ